MLNLNASFQNLTRTFILLFALIIVSCTNNQTETTTDQTDTTATKIEPVDDDNKAEAVLNGTQADTTLSGTVRFSEENGKVEMKLDVQIPKMANKTVAVHLHEHGSCGDMGKEAHGHWNPTKANHGKWGSTSFHLGDIGNVDLDGEGKGTLSLETDLWSLSSTDSTKNILNKAVIVHGGKDDFTTQPTGNAGSRIGCGVIQTAR